ncbi:hypothetical protein [Microbulbifer yueqingensis]|uniref:hypothetical protein n=1 Tax=Microbulbifer yueqingensis TaxID=658219 RepID=UPI00158754C2|nr:hypothetical protein [Microbulbifer yueqingensis]
MVSPAELFLRLDCSSPEPEAVLDCWFASAPLSILGSDWLRLLGELLAGVLLAVCGPD